VADHVLGHVDGNERLAVVDRERVTDHVRMIVDARDQV